MPPVHALYALIETLGGDPERDMELFQEVLAEAQETGLIEEAVIAQTARDRTNLWAVRDDLAEAMRPMQPAVAFDVSMALQDMPAFVEHDKKGLARAQAGHDGALLRPCRRRQFASGGQPR